MTTKLGNNTRKPTTNDWCDSNKMMSYLVGLQVVDPENIVRLANKKHLSTFCKDLGNKLKEADSYMHSCRPRDEDRLYTNLMTGVESLYKTLCLDETYRHSFERHSGCFKKLYNELDNCDGPKDWAEDTNRTRLCKAYKDIVDCYMIKTALVCGPDAADLFKKLLINVLRATVVTDCGLKTQQTADKTFEKPLLTQKLFNIIYLIIIFILIIALIMVNRKPK